MKYKFAGLILLFFSSYLSSFGQTNQFHFSNVDSMEAYKTNGYCRIVNYYWDQGVVDRSGTIYFVVVDNYNLFCHKSSDGGLSWEEEQITTGMEGKVFTAMMGLTQDDKRVIVYSVNQSFSNGSVSFGSEFNYDAYGIVENEAGWTNTSLSVHSGNSGLLPYGIIAVKSGKVHVILNKYGWYNYGGELYEAIYDPGTTSWNSLETIKIFGDRAVDNGTNYVGKTAEGGNESIICMYQRHGSISGKVNLEVIQKTSEGWQEPVVILENNGYSTYNRFDVDYDRKGNTFLAYFEPWSETGPQIFLAHNSIDNFAKYELFEPTDTLLKISIHPYNENKTYLYCSFRHSYPKILEWTEGGVSISEYLPDFAQEDSVDVMRFHYTIPRKNNFSPDIDFIAFTNRYQGKTGDMVSRYPIVFVRTNLAQDFTQIPENSTKTMKNTMLFPNPADDFIELNLENSEVRYIVRIYDITGNLVKVAEAGNKEKINVSGLSKGIYLLKLDNSGKTTKFLKY